MKCLAVFGWIVSLWSVLAWSPAAAQQPNSVDSPAQQLAAARSAWQQAGISRYVYGYNKFCECHAEAPPETLVSVDQGVVTDVRHRMSKTGDVVPAAAKNFELYWTVDDLFALLERATDGTAAVMADFDPEFGVPRRIYIDYLPDLIGDEVDVRITRFDAR
jgi:hypothetical protein